MVVSNVPFNMIVAFLSIRYTDIIVEHKSNTRKRTFFKDCAVSRDTNDVLNMFIIIQYTPHVEQKPETMSSSSLKHTYLLPHQYLINTSSIPHQYPFISKHTYILKR